MCAADPGGQHRCETFGPKPCGSDSIFALPIGHEIHSSFSHMLFERFCSWLSKTVCDYMVHPLRKVSLWRNCCGFRYAAEPSACIQHYTLLLPKGEASIHQTRCSIPWKGVGAGRAPLHRAYLKGNWRSCLKKQPFHPDPCQNMTAGNLLNMEQGQQGVRT